MQDKTFVKMEVVGRSDKSFDEAVNNAVSDVAEKFEASWLEVVELRGRVENGRVVEYQAVVKIGGKPKD